MFRRLVTFAVVWLIIGLHSVSCVFVQKPQRPSDTPIIPNYVIHPEGIRVLRDAIVADVYSITAIPGSFVNGNGQPAAVRMAAYTLSSETVERIRGSSQSSEAIEGQAFAVLTSRADGGLNATELKFSAVSGYLLLAVFDTAAGSLPAPTTIHVPTPSAIIAAISESGVGVFEGLFRHVSKFIWSSPAEIKGLAAIDTSGATLPGFTVIRNQALSTFAAPSLTDPANQTDSRTLAAAVLYMRTGDPAHYQKVIETIDALIGVGIPPTTSNPLFWSTNLVGYVAAADLVGYRTPAFENYLKTFLGDYQGTIHTGDRLSLMESWKYHGTAPGGMDALVALTTIHAYLGQRSEVAARVLEWKRLVAGTVPDITGIHWARTDWSVDKNVPRLLNPPGSTADCNGTPVDISGFFPGAMWAEDMCASAAELNKGAWRMVESMAVFARLAKRQGFTVSDFQWRAIHRAYRAIQARYPVALPELGRAMWITRLLDRSYGTSYSQGMDAVAGTWGAGTSSFGFPWLENRLP